jgi:hypothetical protein
MAVNPAAYYQSADASIFRGHLMYPEPWLYLRTGPRISRWPFHGGFAHVGPWQWELGPAQVVLRDGILLCGLLALFCLIASFRRRSDAVPGLTTRRPAFGLAEGD